MSNPSEGRLAVLVLIMEATREDDKAREAQKNASALREEAESLDAAAKYYFARAQELRDAAAKLA
jgi:protein tyrosine/serine phosphatase